MGNGEGLVSLEAEPEMRILVHVIILGQLSGEGSQVGREYGQAREWSQLESHLSPSHGELWNIHCTMELSHPGVKSGSFVPLLKPLSISH